MIGHKLGGIIAACLGRAAAAGHRAAGATDPELKADHLAMANQWADLARRYESVANLERLLLKQHRATYGAFQGAYGRSPHSVEELEQWVKEIEEALRDWIAARRDKL